MEKYFGITGYRNLGITLKEGVDGAVVSDEIRKLTKSVPKCMVKDYTRMIQAENAFVEQKMLFFYGVAIVMLGNQCASYYQQYAVSGGSEKHRVWNFARHGNHGYWLSPNVVSEREFGTEYTPIWCSLPCIFRYRRFSTIF